MAAFFFSTAAAAMPDHLIQALGRWSSAAYLQYIHTSPDTLAKTLWRTCKRLEIFILEEVPMVTLLKPLTVVGEYHWKRFHWLRKYL
jgi:hypothetical protein